MNSLLRFTVVLILVILLILSFQFAPFIYFQFQDTPSLKPLEPVSIQNQNSNIDAQFILKEANISTLSVWTANQITINIGSDESVLVGNGIVNSNGNLIGVVSKVEAKSSQISLVTSSDLELPVKIRDDKTAGVLSGVYGYSAVVNWIPTDPDLNDSIVYTTSLTTNLKPNIPIGKLTDSKPNQSKSFYQANVKELSSFTSTKGVAWVWVKR